MATIEETIEAALFGHARGLDLDGAPPLAWPNVPFPGEDGGGNELPKPATYIEIRHFPNSNSRLFVKGSDPHLRQGLLQLTVRTPLHAGPDPLTKLAGEVAASFPADLDLFQDGVRVRIQAAPDVGAAEKTDDGVSWAAAVTVRYEAFV